MTKLITLVLVLGAIGCATDDPPSCQQGISHYYGAGCVYTDLATSAPISQNEMINRCIQASASSSTRCQDKINAWLDCNDSVKSPAKTNADCDCSQTYMAAVTCQ